jgi:hypothetical protein
MTETAQWRNIPANSASLRAVVVVDTVKDAVVVVVEVPAVCSR